MKELPIGVQTFEDIVSGNYYYVDKTGMVHQLANKFKYVFLNRPRRFRESLCCHRLSIPILPGRRNSSMDWRPADWRLSG